MAIIDKPSDFFNTKLYTGNASSRTISGIGFQPDWTWSKNRGNDDNHYVFDSVRGATKYIIPDNNTAEGTASGITAWNSDGYALGSSVGINANGVTAVSWNWKAGTSFTNDASSTGIGSMDSAGSVNEEAGFAIVSYTGNETASTLKHGLSTVPQMIIIKGRIAARDWIVGNHNQGWTKSAMLNEQNGFTNQTHFNNTAPTSSVFSIEGGTNSNVNTNNAGYISYIFSERQGYSKFGSYVGNGNADGAFVNLGFKPAFVMIKSSSNSGQAWVMQDNKRDGFNYNNHRLFANSNATEESTVRMDLLSNGFKCRDNDGNGNGFNYIYMAFAEESFVSSSGVPATAR